MITGKQTKPEAECSPASSRSRIPHLEHWSCPDAETFLTGIDYYDHPRQCRLRLRELYPLLKLPVPETDEPKTRPENQKDQSHGRWGDSYREHWQQNEAGSRFQSLDDMLAFSPLKTGDFSGWNVVEDGDYSSEDVIFKRYQKHLPGNNSGKLFFYNTMFMWPMLTFGYENFLMICMEPEFERVMDEFAEISRRVFRAFSRLPVDMVICHDDIVLTNGPVCSPAWMQKFIFPRYREFWGMLKDTGKEVVFMVDGNVDAFVDDVMDCGAKGFITEPYTDFKGIARRYPEVYLAGEGDNRILMRNNPDEIRAMVEKMVDTAQMTGNYHMCIGNHIPWNVPPEAVKLYLDLCDELAYR